MDGALTNAIATRVVVHCGELPARQLPSTNTSLAREMEQEGRKRPPSRRAQEAAESEAAAAAAASTTAATTINAAAAAASAAVAVRPQATQEGSKRTRGPEPAATGRSATTTTTTTTTTTAAAVEVDSATQDAGASQGSQASTTSTTAAQSSGAGAQRARGRRTPQQRAQEEAAKAVALVADLKEKVAADREAAARAGFGPVTSPDLVAVLQIQTAVPNDVEVLVAHAAKVGTMVQTGPTASWPDMAPEAHVFVRLIRPLLVGTHPWVSGVLERRGNAPCSLVEYATTLLAVLAMAAVPFEWEVAWEIIVAPCNPKITCGRAQDIYHAFECFPPDTLGGAADGDSDMWDSLPDARARIEQAEDWVNAGLQMLFVNVPGEVTGWDDHHMRARSRRLLQLVPQVVNMRKHRRGPLVYACVSASTSTPRAIRVRRVGGDKANLKSLPIVPASVSVVDRGFDADAVVEGRSQASVVAIIDEKRTVGMAFNRVELDKKKLEVEGVLRLLNDDTAPQNTVFTYPGQGLEQHISTARDGSATHVTVIDPRAAQPAALRFVVRGPFRHTLAARAPNLILSLASARSSPFAPLFKDVPAGNDSPLVLAIRSYLLAHCIPLTVGQCDKAWFVLRCYCITASLARHIVWRILKDAAMAHLRDPVLLNMLINTAGNEVAQNPPSIEEVMEEEAEVIAGLSGVAFSIPPPPQPPQPHGQPQPQPQPQPQVVAAVAAPSDGVDDDDDASDPEPGEPEQNDMDDELVNAGEDDGVVHELDAPAPSPPPSQAVPVPAVDPFDAYDPNVHDEPAAEQPRVDQRRIPPALRAAYLVSAGILLGVVCKYMTTRFKATDAMQGGKANEPRLLRFLLRAAPHLIKAVYEIGLLRSTRIPWVVASPDGIAVLDAAALGGLLASAGLALDQTAVVNGSVPASVEFKTTSLQDVPFTSAFVPVGVGTQLYFAHVPARFRVQLVQQALVTGCLYNVLVIASTQTVIARLIVCFTRGQLAAYQRFLERSPADVALAWFHGGCAAGDTVEQMVARMPKSDDATMVKLKSHANRARAVNILSLSRGTAPLPPIAQTHTYVQQLYQNSKPWVDQMSQSIEAMTGAFPGKPRGTGALLLEFDAILLYAALRAVRARNTHALLEASGNVVMVARRKANKAAGSFASQAHRMLSSLLRTDVLRSFLAPAGPAPLAAPLAPPATQSGIRAAFPDAVLIRGVQGTNEPVLEYGFPLARATIHKSASTPAKAALERRYLERLQDLIPLWNTAPKPSAKRESLRQYYFGGSGERIRLERKLAHVMVDRSALPLRAKPSLAADAAAATTTPTAAAASTGPPPSTGTAASSSGGSKGPDRRAGCIICLKRVTQSCVMCGVSLCSLCEKKFHEVSVDDLHGAIVQTSSGAVALDLDHESDEE